MADKIYHVPFSKEQIEAAIGKGPIIQKVGSDCYWHLWDIVAMEYVKTDYPALIGNFEQMQAEANRAEAAEKRAVQSAIEAKQWADKAAEQGGGAGAGSAEPSELEDYSMEVGQFTNAAAGWCTQNFREPFDAPPTVILQAVGFSGWVEIRNITATGFQYCLRQPSYTAGSKGSVGSVTTGSFYTADGAAASKTHTEQTLVSAVELPTQPTLPTASNKTTASKIMVNYIAIEYGGER